MATSSTAPKAPKLLTPAVLQISQLLKEEIPTKVDQCLGEITRFFATAFPKCTRMDMVVALTDLYAKEDFLGLSQIARRIVLHYVVFLSHEYEGFIHEQTWNTNCNTGISPFIAVLLKCYGTPQGSSDSIFADMSNAERQFIGRLLGYSKDQRRMFLYDETPNQLAKVANDDPHISAASSLIREPGSMKRIADLFCKINRGLAVFQAYRGKESSESEEDQPLVLVADDIVPLDAVHSEIGDIGEDTRITWVPVPPGLFDMPYDAAVMYAPIEYVERLQREREQNDAQHKQQERLITAAANAAAAVAAEQKRQADEHMAKAKAMHERALLVAQQQSQQHQHQNLHPGIPIPCMMSPAGVPIPQYNPMMIHQLEGLMQQHAQMQGGFFHQPHFNSAAALMEMQAHQNMQAAYFAGMGPAVRKIPCFSVPPGFAPMMHPPFPHPDDAFRLPPPPPPPPTAPPGLQTVGSDVIAIGRPNTAAVDTAAPTSRKPTMSEIVKRNLTPPPPPPPPPSKTRPPVFDGMSSGDSNIDECFSKVMALVNTPFGMNIWPPKSNPKADDDCEPRSERVMAALRTVFEGDLPAVRHEHLEVVKAYFDGCNYEPFKEIKVTNARLIELITMNPNVMGLCLAFMLRSGDEKVFNFISELIAGNFCPMTVVVLVRFVVEIFRHSGAFNNKAFINTVITTCLSYLNDPVIQEMRTSVEGRLVRLVITLLYMHVLYIPKIVEHRMDELLAMTSCYSSLRFASSTYHAIVNYRKKHAARLDPKYTSVAVVPGIKS